MKQFINSYIVPPLAYWMLYFISATLKVIEVNKDIEKALDIENNTAIGTLWHSRIFFIPYYYRTKRHRVSALASPSTDGEIIARILSRFGFNVVRGSSFKNSRSALRELRRCVEDGQCLVLIADGSRGPALKLQSGSLMLSKLTGRPVLPFTVSFSKYWTINSWDRLMIPRPFSSAVVMYGNPVTVLSSSDSQQMELKRLELEKTLLDITEQADTYFKKP